MVYDWCCLNNNFINHLVFDNIDVKNLDISNDDFISYTDLYFHEWVLTRVNYNMESKVIDLHVDFLHNLYDCFNHSVILFTLKDKWIYFYDVVQVYLSWNDSNLSLLCFLRSCFSFLDLPLVWCQVFFTCNLVLDVDNDVLRWNSVNCIWIYVRWIDNDYFNVFVKQCNHLLNLRHSDSQNLIFFSQFVFIVTWNNWSFFDVKWFENFTILVFDSLCLIDNNCDLNNLKKEMFENN